MIKRLLLFITAGLILTSCIEINVHYIINPDKSGKVETSYLMPVDPMGFGVTLENPEAKAMEEMYKMFDEYPGVATWNNIKYEYINDSADLVISATGYFDNFNSLKEKGILPYEIQKEGKDTYFTFKTYLDSVHTEEGKSELKSLDELGITEKDLQDSVRKLKRNFKKGLGMFAMMMGNIEFNTTYEFAGSISTPNGSKIGDGTKFKVGLDGLKFQNYMMEEMDNDEYYESLIRGASPFDVDTEPSENQEMKKMVLEFLSGEKEDISKIKVDFGKPKFDYKKELKKAKKDWDSWKKKNAKYKEETNMKKS
ncbi:MAG: hypothetical protein WC121_12525 [Candidatus Kapaibacterium sp.]